MVVIVVVVVGMVVVVVGNIEILTWSKVGVPWLVTVCSRNKNKTPEIIFYLFKSYILILRLLHCYNRPLLLRPLLLPN